MSKKEKNDNSAMQSALQPTAAAGGTAGTFPNNNGKPCTGQPGSKKATSSVNKKAIEKQQDSVPTVHSQKPKGVTVEHEYVVNFIEEHESDLKSYANKLAKNFWWIKKKYGTEVNEYLLYRAATRKYRKNAVWFANHPNPLAAMKASMRNIAVDMKRKIKRENGYAFDAGVEPNTSVVDTKLPVDTMFMYIELEERAQHLMQTIPERYKAGLQYAIEHFINGKKVNDIAAEKGVDHSNISRPMHSTLKYIKKCLIDEGYI